MLRTRIGLSAVALSAVAAIGSVALSAATAQSSVRMTAKQAALMGLPALTKQVREPTISRLIVKFRDSDMAQALGAGQTQALAARAGAGMKAMRVMGDKTSLLALDVPVRLSEARAIAARLADDPAVEYAEPDVMMKVQLTPTDVDYQPKQWNLLAAGTAFSGAIISTVMPPPPALSRPAVGGINAPTAWDTQTGAASVVVAIVDTGIVNHPDLNGSMALPGVQYAPAGKFLAGYDFVSANLIAGQAANFVENDNNPGRDNDPSDPGDNVTAGEKAIPQCDQDDPNEDANGDSPSSWHGSFMAGIVAATASNPTNPVAVGSIAGVAHGGTRILPVRALGKCGGSLGDIAAGIRWAAGGSIPGVTATPAATANIILLSFGGRPGDACPQPLQDEINFAVNTQKITVIAAAGNDGDFRLRAPANCDNVIAVTSHSINGENAQYSNIATQVTISAPGGGVPSSLGTADPAIDNPAWYGFYVWSTGLCGTTTPQSGGGCLAANQTGPGILPRVGTSAAAAQVAGVAALIKSKAPNADPVQVRGALTTSARPFADTTKCAPGFEYAGRCGVGMLDATRALQAAGPPVVVTAPRAVSVAAGATASFTVEAIGAASYQWTRAGANIAGATGPSYTTGALAATDNNAAFAVVMTNAFGTSTSPAAVLTVTGTSANSPSSGGGGGALPAWQLLLLSALLLAARVRVNYREQ